jgi:hypothetical protein
MIKFKHNLTGQEFTLGEQFEYSYFNKETNTKVDYSKTLTPQFALELVALGVLTEIEVKPKITLKDAFEMVERELHLIDMTYDQLYDVNPYFAYQTLLRAVAILLDEQYGDYISDAKELYFIDIFHKKILPADDFMRNHPKVCSLFRSVEDAQYAIDLTKDYINDVNEWISE